MESHQTSNKGKIQTKIDILEVKELLEISLKNLLNAGLSHLNKKNIK